MQRILVIGSSNTDMVVKTNHFPAPGHTVIGGDFFMFPGGKGANQAVAAARLGGQVSLLCCLGKDLFGLAAKEGFAKEGIDCRHVHMLDDRPTGVALITVDAQGQNSIVVAPGANYSLDEAVLQQSLDAISAAVVLLLQLEIPIASVAEAVRIGHQAGKKIILNPAPAQAFPDDLWSRIFLFTPNEFEASVYAGIDVIDEATAIEAAQLIRARGVVNVLITMGSMGALFLGDGAPVMMPACRVDAIDSTAAGDVYNGALAVAIAEGMPWSSCLDFARRAAAISVTRLGAQASAPTRKEVQSFNPR
jgi:ribokinase